MSRRDPAGGPAHQYQHVAWVAGPTEHSRNMPEPGPRDGSPRLRAPAMGNWPVNAKDRMCQADELSANGMPGTLDVMRSDEGSQMISQRVADEKISSVSQTFDIYVADESVEAVYISGSLMAGLGTPYSDVDIFVICADRNGMAQHGKGTSRVGVEFRSPQWLEQVAALAAPYTASFEDNYPLTTSPSLIDDAVRLKIGKVLKASPQLSAARNALDAGQRDFQKLLISQLALDLASLWMDALGFLSNSDQDSLGVLSGDILLTALDAACITSGDLYRGTKWIWSRVRRSEDLAPSAEWLRGLLLPQSRTDSRLIQPSMMRLLAAQKLMALALLREWSPGEHSPFPEEAPCGRTGLVRSPYWMAVRMAQGAILTDRDARHFTVPDLALACWAAADGLPRADIHNAVASVYQAKPEKITRTVDALMELGAITPVTAWSDLYAR